MRSANTRTRRFRGLSALLIGTLLGAVMLAPVAAAPSDPATKRFVAKKVRMLKQRIARKANRSSVYTKEQTQALLPDGFVATRNGPFTAGGAGTVGTYSVPAGEYVVEAKLQISNTTSNADITCTLLGGGQKLDETTVTVGGAVGMDHVVMVLLGAMDTDFDEAVIELRCPLLSGPDTSGHFLRIAATEVADLAAGNAV